VISLFPPLFLKIIRLSLECVSQNLFLPRCRILFREYDVSDYCNK